MCAWTIASAVLTWPRSQILGALRMCGNIKCGTLRSRFPLPPLQHPSQLILFGVQSIIVDPCYLFSHTMEVWQLLTGRHVFQGGYTDII